jgi:tRNA(Ile)-lysidine synthase
MPSRFERRFLDVIGRALSRIGVRRDALTVLALSGGPDSVAMLRAMVAMGAPSGYRLMAAHLNHGIRAGESERDEAFVRELCRDLGVELAVERARGLSAGMPNLEERARQARHEFLNAVADRCGADYIALAHQADDQAETVMLRLLRGAGASGLGAMDERGPGRLIRPMLTVTRNQVLAYLRALGQAFVIDSTNETEAPARNRIRAGLLPMLERDWAPGLSHRLVDLAGEMRSLDDFVASAAARQMDLMVQAGGALDLSRFSTLHPALQAAVLRLFLKGGIGDLKRLGRVHIEAVRRLCLFGPPNGTVDLPAMWQARREYGLLRLSGHAPEVSRYAVALAAQGETVVSEAGFVFETAVVQPFGARKAESRYEALFDAGEARNRLVVRNFVPGDRIAPLGLGGHRKLQDVFVDAKLPRKERATFPILELDGEVAWLPGLVRGRVALVTEATAKVLVVRARAGV